MEWYLDRRPTRQKRTVILVDHAVPKVSEGGRIVNVVIAAVNADGYREIPDVDVITNEDGAGWTAFLRSEVTGVDSFV